MKMIFIKLNLLFTFILVFLNCSIELKCSDQLHIFGKIYSIDTTENYQFIGSTIFIKSNDKILAKHLIVDEGNFSLKFNRSESGSYDLFVSYIGIDTVFLKPVVLDDIDSLNVNIAMPIKPKK